MFTIGVTGNIGSGKSAVCSILRELGAVVIDADALVHEAYRPHSEIWKELVDIFSKDILKSNGEIDRQKLGEMAFTQPEVLECLNNVIHPAAHRIAKQKIEGYRHHEVKVLVLEAPLLIEADWLDLVNEVWLVVTSRDLMLQRVSQSREVDSAQVMARLETQMPAEAKVHFADEVIDNDGSFAQLEERVNALWRKVCERVN